MSWSFDEETLSWVRSNLDSFITEWGKDCTLVYPPRWESCANCWSEPGPGGKSANRWRHGGPLPFPNGTICPLCSGSGKFRAAEETESIRLLCVFDPARFFYPLGSLFRGEAHRSPLDVRQPFSLLQTKGYLADLPKLQRADHLLAQTPIAGYTRLAYKMSGEGLDLHNVVQGRYVVVLWERA